MSMQWVDSDLVPWFHGHGKFFSFRTRKEEAASSRKEEAASSRMEEADSCRNEGLGSYSLMLLYSHDACFCLGIYEAFVKPMVFFCVYHMGKLG